MIGGHDLKTLGRMIEIVTSYGSRVSTSAQKAVGNAGPNVEFGCDQGGAYISLFGRDRMTLDDAKTLAADLFTAITYADWREWLCDHGMAVRND